MAKKFRDPRRNTTTTPMYESSLYNTDGPRVVQDMRGDDPEYLAPRRTPFTNVYTNPSFTPKPVIDSGYVPPTPDDFNVSSSGGGISDNAKLGIAGAAPGVIGGVVGAIAADKRLRDLKRQDLTPSSIKEGAGDAQLRAASAKVANYGQQVEDINANATKATAAVNAAATTGSQAVQAAGNIQANTNRAFRNLNGQGLVTQDQRRNRFDRYRDLLAKYRDKSNDQYNQERSALYNARAQNLQGAFNSAASGAMLAL